MRVEPPLDSGQSNAISFPQIGPLSSRFGRNYTICREYEADLRVEKRGWLLRGPLRRALRDHVEDGAAAAAAPRAYGVDLAVAEREAEERRSEIAEPVRRHPLRMRALRRDGDRDALVRVKARPSHGEDRKSTRLNSSH